MSGESTPDTVYSPRAKYPHELEENGGPDDQDSTQDLERSAIAPPRPKFLGEFIDAQKEHFETFDDKYFTFMQYAIEAVDVANESPMAVNVALRLGEDLDTTAEFKSTIPVNSNNNFSKLFYFYSSFGEVVEGSSFEKIGNENQSWSHNELEVFLRDLGVMPKLLSRDEMGEVWNGASNARVARHDKALSQVNLDEGKEMIARIALFIYMRPGMKRMILSTTGSFPSPVEMVQCLVHFMGLDNDDFVNDHIKIGKGKQTQGRINYVSKHEIKDIGKEHTESDLRYQRMAGNSFKRAAFDAKLKKKKEENVLKELEGARRRAKLREDRSQVRAQSDKFIPDSIKVLLSRPSVVDKDKGSRPGTREDDSRPGTREGTAADEPGSEKLSKAELQAARDLEVLQTVHEPPRDEHYLDCWTDDLTNILDAYCQEPKLMKEDPYVEISGGSFVDAGHLEYGTPITILVCVKNRSAHEMHVDLLARNFEDEHNARITTKSGLLAPGISRQMQVNLQAGRYPGSTVGIMELDLHNRLHAYHETVVIPVFFYVGDHNLMGKNITKPATAENIQNRFDAAKRERIAAGLPVDETFYLRRTSDEYVGEEEDGVPNAVDIEGGSVASSLNMGSITSLQQAQQSDNKSNAKGRMSLHQGLSLNFGRQRQSWYGERKVGGGGKSIGAFGKDLNNSIAGSGASVAASLRSSSIASMMRSGKYHDMSRPSTEEAYSGKPIGRQRAQIGHSLFDDGSVFANDRIREGDVLGGTE